MTLAWWSSITAEAADSFTGYVAAAFLLWLLLSRRRPPEERRALRSALLLLVIHLLLLPVAGLLRHASSPLYGEARLLSLAFLALCAVRLAADLFFGVLLPRVGWRTSRILQDVVMAAASIVALFSLASRAGLNVAGLVATSAVVTAVVGLALRDTLGNVIGGLALQTDRSIRIGDWIKVGEVEGRVVEIRWRYAAVETRNGETLIVPNSLLTGEKVMVLGRRQGQPLQWRRWVHFNVDFQHPLTEVSQVVLGALQEASLGGVSSEPPPDVVVVDFQAGYARYAVRYWLTDLQADVAVDSQIRTRVYFALQRAGLSLSLPAHSIFLTEESRERRQELQESERGRRLQALQRVELFRPLSEEDRQFLAESLHYAPFAAGEVLTRQGAEAHWLYLIVEGRVAVRVAVADGGLDREVAQLGEGDFFGEMSLMTGEPRSATVVALTPVRCYRLDKAAFQEILRRRPSLADPVAEILARRRVGLTAAREDLDQEARKRRVVAVQVDLLARIRDFFGLTDDAPRPRAAR
jgi:small-conductance mechanosensitive channel/CRP-like cAMP-binding protein